MSYQHPRIGGTMAANILGVGFKTRYEAWAILTGKVQPEDISNVERVEAGIFMEPAAKAWFSKRTGLKVLDSPGLMTDKVHSWAAGTPDGLVVMPDGSFAILECKSTHVFARDDWRTNEGFDSPVVVPLGYQVQGEWYLKITGLQLVWFAAIVGGNHLETPSMKRDDAFIGSATEQIEHFLDAHVQKDVPPQVSGADIDVLKRLWPKDSGRSLMADANAPETIALQEMIRLKREIKALEKGKDEAEAIVKAAMTDATTLVTPNATATWKSQVSNFEARPARTVEMRVLRTKE